MSGVAQLNLFHHYQIPNRRALGVGQSGLIFGRIVAFDCRFQRWKPGHHVARAVVAFKLHMATTTGKKDTTICRNSDGGPRRVTCVSVGVGDMHMGNPEGGWHGVIP